jgi:CRP/FNR family transcriptional regulator, cyclic AMP receptor protein
MGGSNTPVRTRRVGMRAAGLFSNASEPRELQAGEVLFSEGDQGEEMYGIVDGSIELTVGGQTIAELGPDDVFGEMAIIDHTTRMATATATSASHVVSIDRRRFLFLVHETPMFALQVMSALAERLRQEA